jgi:hypothetical protein
LTRHRFRCGVGYNSRSGYRCAAHYDHNCDTGCGFQNGRGSRVRYGSNSGEKSGSDYTQSHGSSYE